MRSFYTISAIIFNLAMTAFAQEAVHHFPPVQVTASRLENSLVSEIRNLEVLTQSDIACLPVTTLPEVMQFTQGVDYQQRGWGGVQGDFSIRGSGFEQVLILLDGVRLNDPQTGHHNTDIPVSLTQIERIEVLQGHASALYGPDAYGGVIHIITRQPESSGSALSLRGGGFNTLLAQFSQTLRFKSLSSTWHFEHQQSAGYRPVTDFRINTITQTIRWVRNKQLAQFTAGTVVKDFGANGYYADYPSREKTGALLGIFNYTYHPHRWLNWNLRTHVRRHNDHFVLDYTRPDWIENDHVSRVLGLETTLRFYATRQLEMAVGCDILKESLTSSNLGDHTQTRNSLYSEIILPVYNGVVQGGFRLDRQEPWGFQASPSLNMGFPLSEIIRWRSAMGRIFRAPTFTERFYQSPANIGNPDLDPEQGWNLETGLDIRTGQGSFHMTLFWRKERNRIDWVAEKTGDPWTAVNLGRMNTPGISLSMKRNGTARRWVLSYTYLHQTQWSPAAESKYQYRFLRHQINLNMTGQGPWLINHSWYLTLKKRDHEPPVWLFSVKWARNFGLLRGFLEGRNLLNSHYQEILYVPMPGRYFMAGFELNWGSKKQETRIKKQESRGKNQD
jgi:vitamin B12 transporter